MKTVVLDLARLQFVLTFLNLHRIAHLSVIIDILDNEDLSHLKDNEELHWDELVE